ncbi:MAG: energy transducer TonB [Bacteroidota bacterium]
MVQIIIQLLRQGWQPLRELWEEGGVEEVVFANRNKAYGAYVLRRNEGWYLLTALSIVVGGLLSVGWISTKIKTAGAEAEYEYRTIVLSCGFDDAVLPPPPPLPQRHYCSFWQMPTPAPLAEVLTERPVIGLGQVPISEIDSKLDTLLYAAVLDTPDHPLEIEALAAPQDWLIPEIEETEADIPDIIREEMPDIGSFVIVPDEPKPLNLSEIIKLVKIPQVARDAGLSGPVVFRVLIGKDGYYKRHKVINGHPILAKAFEEHLPLLRCEPAMEGDKPVAYWINIPFTICFLE